jgi:hypothetical protein
MLHAIEADESAYPEDISLFGAQAVVAGANPVPDDIQQARLVGFHAIVRRSKWVPGRKAIKAPIEGGSTVLYGHK